MVGDSETYGNDTNGATVGIGGDDGEGDAGWTDDIGVDEGGRCFGDEVQSILILNEGDKTSTWWVNVGSIGVMVGVVGSRRRRLRVGDDSSTSGVTGIIIPSPTTGSTFAGGSCLSLAESTSEASLAMWYGRVDSEGEVGGGMCGVSENENRSLESE